MVNMCIISGVIPAASCRGLYTVLDNVAWHSLIFSFDVSSQINERSQMTTLLESVYMKSELVSIRDS